MNIFSTKSNPPVNSSTTNQPPPAYSEKNPSEDTQQKTENQNQQKTDFGSDFSLPSMEHSTTSTRTNTGGSWFSSTASSNPNSGILPQFVGFGGAPNGEGGDGTPNQERLAAARKLFDILRQRLRPWSTEFFAFSKFGWPPSIVGVVPRIKHNLQYFTTNYLCLVVILLVYCILTSFLMLLTLIVLGGLIYTIYTRTQKGPVVFAGQEIPPSLLYTGALMLCFPMFYLADVGEVMYWVIGSSMFLVLAHATFYCSEEVPGSEFEVVNVVTA